jgi:hypothetical protein
MGTGVFRRLVGRWLAPRLITWASRRPPSFVIGGPERPYLLRWWVIPRNRWFNVYLHQVLRSDDDRALHDHPWPNLSLLLQGAYAEHTIAAGGVHRRRLLAAGDVKFRLPGAAHRLEIVNGACWTLFLTGPVVREWGFHCPGGWIGWRRFTDPADQGLIGPGCGDAGDQREPALETRQGQYERQRAVRRAELADYLAERELPGPPPPILREGGAP